MAHEITIRENGLAEAIYANNPAWHGLGTVFSEPIYWADCVKVPSEGGAGLGWSVGQEPMGRFTHDPSKINEWRENPSEYVANYGDPWLPCINEEGEANVLANVRQDTGLYLGNVTNRYVVVQNEEAFRFMDALVDDGQMLYESAFSLSGGKKVCLLGRIPGVDTVADKDHQLRYMLMTLCHDGSGSIKFGPTSVRVVCANTYKMAIDSKGSKIKDLTIRHTGNLDEKLAEAKTILKMAQGQFDEHIEMCNELAKRRLSTDEWVKFLDIICPQIPREDPRWTQRRENAVADTRDGIRLAYHDENQDAAPFTCWAAFNAVTQHIDHLPRRGRDEIHKAEARFNQCLYGTGHTQKAFALETLKRIAGITTSA